VFGGGKWAKFVNENAGNPSLIDLSTPLPLFSTTLDLWKQVLMIIIVAFKMFGVSFYHIISSTVFSYFEQDYYGFHSSSYELNNYTFSLRFVRLEFSCKSGGSFVELGKVT
jgi:hypothetical protein